MTQHRTRVRLATTGATMAALAALSACGDSGSPPAQGTSAQQPGAGGGLLSVAQAELAARQWWSQDEQALVHDDGAALRDRLDTGPLSILVAHEAGVSAAMGHALLGAPREPTAVRVFVPAEQSFPLHVLAVFEAPSGNGGAVGRVAEIFVQRSASAQLVAEQSAILDAPEPHFDGDANGLVRTIPAAAQAATLGRKAADLPALFDAYMDGVAHGQPPPGAPAFAPGRHTSDIAKADAAYLSDAPARSKGSISTVELGYIPIDGAAPVFAVSGGGGFTMFAVQRTETLHPASGQAFVQDGARKNWGVDLAPGQYPQITVQSLVLVAALLPAGGGPVEVLGTGGGVVAEG